MKMSHIAVYRISLNNFNKRYAYHRRFQETFRNVMGQILENFKMDIRENGQISFLCSAKGLRFNVLFTDNGIQVVTDSDFLKSMSGEELNRLVKQVVVSSVQLVRYKKYQVKQKGSKLYVEVLA